MSVKQKLIMLVSVSLNSSVSSSDNMHQIRERRVPSLLALSNLNVERMNIRAQTLEVLTLESETNVQEKLSIIKKNFEYFKEQKGKQFDLKLVDLFFENLDNFLEIRNKFKDIVK